MAMMAMHDVSIEVLVDTEHNALFAQNSSTEHRLRTRRNYRLVCDIDRKYSCNQHRGSSSAPVSVAL